MKQSSLESVNMPSSNKEEWVGQSSAIEQTKQRLIAMANSALPVLIYGEKGTGKVIAARMLHDNDKGENAPFIIIQCKKQEGDALLKRLEDGWVQAQGGSLFVRDIDVLNDNESNKLRMLLSHADMFDRKKMVRLITSTRQEPQHENQSVLGNRLIEWMHYHSFTLTLPALKDRADDVQSLINYYQQQTPAVERLQIDSNALMFLKNYVWPENVSQLKEYLNVLASKDYLSTINRQVLLDISPNVALTQEGRNTIDRTSDFSQSVQETHYSNEDTQKSSLVRILADKIPLTTASSIARNPTLDKAIAYIYNNFTQPITLDELASHVCISSSHLSYLFKNSLGLSFKQILLLLRIVEAMKLLSENPNRQVTQVCDDVGFCDLSFFIRKFKATVGVSPGIYRNQYGQVKNSPELLKVEEALAHPLLHRSVAH